MLRISPALLAAIVLSTSAFAADNWPNWRGPNYNGVGSGSGRNQFLSRCQGRKRTVCQREPLACRRAAHPCLQQRKELGPDSGPGRTVGAG